MNVRSTAFILLSVSVLALAAPSSASAQASPLQGRTRAHAYFHVGFSGEIESNGASGDADGTIGFGGRYEYTLSDIFSVGGQAQFSFWRPEIPFFNPDRSTLLDFGGTFRARYEFDMGDLSGEVYGIGVFGLTLSILDNDWVGDDSKLGGGFHLGISAGFACFFTDSIGAFMELGWIFHQIWQAADGFDDGHLNQGAMQLGVQIRI